MVRSITLGSTSLCISFNVNASILWPYWNLVCNRAVKYSIPASCRPSLGVQVLESKSWSPYCCVRARVHLSLLITPCDKSVCTDLGVSHKGCFTFDQTDPYTFDNKCYLKFRVNINIGSRIAPPTLTHLSVDPRTLYLLVQKRGPWFGRSALTVCLHLGT